MIKKISILMRVIIISLAAILFVPTIPSYALDSEKQAPNMLIDWADKSNKTGYDLMMVDWYCEVNANNTYWAVHNWENGYAGFQNKEGKHKLILSIWDGNDGKKPVIEYITKKGKANNFGGEGTGRNILTDYNWKVGQWYSMCVGTRTINGKTQYAQWVREGDGDWLLTAIISYPETRRFKYDMMFQEDWSYNNLLRKCRVKNAYARKSGTKTWESWRSGNISNYRYLEFSGKKAYGEKAEYNMKYDCNWGVTGNDGGYIMLQAGGKTKAVNKQLPFQFKLSNQRSMPAAANPVWPAVKRSKR